MPLDGDMAGIILPSEAYTPLMKDPFGFGVILHDQSYASPNRFFAHWVMSGYYKTFPFLFQHLVSPLDSIYLSGAIAKILIQLFLLLVIAGYISSSPYHLWKTTVLAAALFVPLFQTDGYNGLMGIIDKSVTYSFFYALPIGILLTLLLPYYKRYFLGMPSKWGRARVIYMILASVFVTFSCPLIPGIMLILAPGTLIFFFIKGYRRPSHRNSYTGNSLSAIKNIPALILWPCIYIIMISMYSIYLGTFSTENPPEPVSLLDRYSYLAGGLWSMLSQKLGFPVIFLMIGINFRLLKMTTATEKFGLVMKMAFGIALFSLAYLALLPLGGYREYRPEIVRRDTLLPILLALFFLFSFTSFEVLQLKTLKYRSIYIFLITVVLAFFTINDKPDFSQDHCERSALRQLQQSPEKIVRLDDACTVMSWHIMTDYRESEVRGKILKYWGVLDEVKCYYQ